MQQEYALPGDLVEFRQGNQQWLKGSCCRGELSFNDPAKVPKSQNLHPPAPKPKLSPNSEACGLFQRGRRQHPILGCLGHLSKPFFVESLVETYHPSPLVILNIPRFRKGLVFRGTILSKPIVYFGQVPPADETRDSLSQFRELLS